ncbi:MAG TPA: M3 family oligoendopeptidase [Armatimonadetes bacterium]|nr:M3 family oligoendopeptidase [Armatimonadota bacterium]
MTTPVTWDLSDLYVGVEDPKLTADLDRLDARAARFAEAYRGKVGQLSPPDFAAALVEYEAIQRDVQNPSAFAQLVFAADSLNPAHGALVQLAQEREVAIGRQLLFFSLEIVELPDDHFARLLEDPTVAEYRHYLEHLRSERPHRLTEPEERILLEKSITGRSAFQRLFDETIGAATFKMELHGATQEMNLSEILAKQHDANRTVRAASAAALTAGMEERSRLLSYITNTLAHDKAVDDRLTRFSHPEASRHLSDEVDTDTVHTMLDACVDHFGTVARYYHLKREMLGLDQLYHYDRYAPLFPEESATPWEEARDIVVDAYTRFSPTVGDLARRFFDQRWVDAEVRPGKRGGAFCMGIAPDWHPYVLMNYLGKQRDVLTLAHELGHGIHDLLASGQHFLEYHPSLAAAETASVFGEMLTFDALLARDLPAHDRLSLLTEQIEGIFATVFRQTAMYRFEQRLHAARREHGELPTDRINALWQESIQAMFGDSVAMGEGHRVWWMYVPHFIHTPFYVYAYAFGQLLVIALYARYQREGQEFVPRYLDILRAGGSKRPADLMAGAGIDISQRAFWEDGLRVVDSMVTRAEEAWREVEAIA